MAIIGALLILWLILVFIGFAVKALLWLAIAAIVLFLGTAAFGVVQHLGSKPPRSPQSPL